MTKFYAVAGWKYEPKWLVDDMKANMSWFDKVVIVDTRKRTDEFWIDEGEYRILQRQALVEAGIKFGDWVFVTSPDERLEGYAEDFIKGAVVTLENQKTIFSFMLREMWTPTQYRVDGLWGRKTRPRLYPFLPMQEFSKKRIQQSPIPLEQNYERVLLDCNIYHLKQIEPESRVGRAEAYKQTDPNNELLKKNSSSVAKIDPEGVFAEKGYDYLYDETGLELEELPKFRGFTPKYKKKYIFKTN